MVDEQAKVEQRRKPSQLAWRWQFFWMRVSGWRTAWALLLAIPPLLALIYLALPSDAQAPVVAALQAAGQALGATGLRAAVEAALVVCALASFALLLAPGARTARYLHASTSVIPPMTVYVDAENLTNPTIRAAMVDHLRREFLIGARAKVKADLLFFMDAQDTRLTYKTIVTPKGVRQAPVPKSHYEALYKNGFRLINSPHVFTGESAMAEAADREIAMHALERALTSDRKLEFVIVSGDGDYAPLIYRLIALGHAVQIWMWGGTRAYSDAARYMPITVYNLDTRSYVDPKKEAPPPAAETASASDPAPNVAESHAPQPPAPQVSVREDRARPIEESRVTLATWDGREKLYRAIVETLTIRQQCEARLPSGSDEERARLFSGELGARLSPHLQRLGYEQTSRVVYWLQQLAALGVVTSTGEKFPRQGAVTPEDGAQRLAALVVAAADAASQTRSKRSDGYLNSSAIRKVLMSERLASAAQAALETLMSTGTEGQQQAHTRYLVYCARGLGLIYFRPNRLAPDLVGHLRLSPSGKQLIAETLGTRPETPETPETPEATV